MNPSLDDLQSALVRLAPPTPTLAPASVPAGAVPEAAPAPSDVVPAAPNAPCQLTDAKTRGFHLDARVAPDQIVAAAELLDQSGFVIDTVTGVDWMAAGEMELVYDFFHLTAPLHVVVRTRVPRDNPELPTISEVFPGANWHERETHEFFGIKFSGHPDLSPLLLPEDADYHPLRRDFAGAA